MNLRLVHYPSTDLLPERGWKILREGFARRRTAASIAANLLAAGFKVSERTIYRRACQWRAEEARRRALVEFGEAGLASVVWRPHEIFAIVDGLDFKPGWYIRGKRQIGKLIDRFLNESTPEGLRRIEAALLGFALGARVRQRIGQPGERKDASGRTAGATAIRSVSGPFYCADDGPRQGEKSGAA